LLGSRLIEVGLVLLHQPAEMALIEDDEEVQVFAPDTAQNHSQRALAFGT
jgi:hypothetical protein